MKITLYNNLKPFIILRENTWASASLLFSKCGWGNGYVALPEHHKWYGLGYDDIDVDVHGGLTYSEEEIIDKKKWWVIGFDTAHYSDTRLRWPKENVQKEAERLLEQCL